MQIRASLKPNVYEKWEKLLSQTGHNPQGLVTALINHEWERRQGKSVGGIKKGVGRPADSAAAKSAKFYVRHKIQFLQSLKDEKRTLPNFELARIAMQTLMDAHLWERATEYMQTNWWAQGSKLPEPDWQSWLKEAEAE